MGFYKLKAWAYLIQISLAMFEFGYSVALFNATEDLISENLSWGSKKAYYLSICQGAVPVGMVIGAHVSGHYSIIIGKRRTFINFQLVFIVGTILLATLSTPVIILGRFFIGLASGVFYSITQNYISEVTPFSLRKIGSITVSSISFGGYSLCCFIALGLPYNAEPNDSMFWVSFMIVFPACFAILQIILFIFWFKFDTPAWLLDTNNLKDFDLALKFLYFGEDLTNAKSEIEGRKLLMTNEIPSFKEIFTEKRFIKMTRVSSILLIFLQLSGINTVLFYSSKMFRDITDDLFISRLFSAFIGLATTFSSYLSSVSTNLFKRKTLVQCSLFILFILNFCIGLISKYAEDPKIPIIIVSLIYIFICMSMLGTVIWVFVMETVNIRILAFASMTSMAMNSVLIILFPILRQFIHISIIFYFFGVSCLIGTFYANFDMVETKGLNKKQVAEAFLLAD